jgi:hypothetical protein
VSDHVEQPVRQVLLQEVLLEVATFRTLNDELQRLLPREDRSPTTFLGNSIRIGT